MVAVAARAKAMRKQYRQRITNYLLLHPCIDCGEGDVRCLDFDHVPGEIKAADVAALVTRLTAWKTIEAEIAKCDVRCANCHRRRTSERAGWWRQTVHEQTQQRLGEASAERLRRLLAVQG